MGREFKLSEFQKYLIEIGARKGDVVTYETEYLYQYIDYFEQCYKEGLSAYKALIFLPDHILSLKLSNQDTSPIVMDNEDKTKEIVQILMEFGYLYKWEKWSNEMKIMRARFEAYRIWDIVHRKDE